MKKLDCDWTAWTDWDQSVPEPMYDSGTQVSKETFEDFYLQTTLLMADGKMKTEHLLQRGGAYGLRLVFVYKIHELLNPGMMNVDFRLYIAAGEEETFTFSLFNFISKDDLGSLLEKLDSRHFNRLKKCKKDDPQEITLPTTAVLYWHKYLLNLNKFDPKTEKYREYKLLTVEKQRLLILHILFKTNELFLSGEKFFNESKVLGRFPPAYVKFRHEEYKKAPTRKKYGSSDGSVLIDDFRTSFKRDEHLFFKFVMLKTFEFLRKKKVEDLDEDLEDEEMEKTLLDELGLQSYQYHPSSVGTGVTTSGQEELKKKKKKKRKRKKRHKRPGRRPLEANDFEEVKVRRKVVSLSSEEETEADEEDEEEEERNERKKKKKKKRMKKQKKNQNEETDDEDKKKKNRKSSFHFHLNRLGLVVENPLVEKYRKFFKKKSHRFFRGQKFHWKGKKKVMKKSKKKSKRRSIFVKKKTKMKKKETKMKKKKKETKIKKTKKIKKKETKMKKKKETKKRKMEISRSEMKIKQMKDNRRRMAKRNKKNLRKKRKSSSSSSERSSSSSTD